MSISENKRVEGVLERARRYILRATLPNPRRFYSYEFFVAQHADRLLHPDFLAAVDREAPYAVLERHWRQDEEWHLDLVVDEGRVPFPCVGVELSLDEIYGPGRSR